MKYSARRQVFHRLWPGLLWHHMIVLRWLLIAFLNTVVLQYEFWHRQSSQLLFSISIYHFISNHTASDLLSLYRPVSAALCVMLAAASIYLYACHYY